jgi:hypothetical protein
VVIALSLFARAIRSALVLQVGDVGREPWLSWGAAVVSYAILFLGGIGLLTRSAGGLYLVAVALLLMAARAMVIVWVLFVTLSEEAAVDELPGDGA